MGSIDPGVLGRSAEGCGSTPEVFVEFSLGLVALLFSCSVFGLVVSFDAADVGSKSLAKTSLSSAVDEL